MASWLRRNRGFLLFLIGLGLFRTAIADWNPIPSGSMRPTLLEGDVVLVNRVAYDLKLPLTDVSLARLGEPARGDVVTFSSPQDGTRLIKRIAGLPGDVIEIRAGVLFVNGVPCRYSDVHVVQEQVGAQAWTEAIRATEGLSRRPHAVQFMPNVQARRELPPTVVPPDHFFMLGDNRDNSADSRYIGFVSRELLIGRAHHVLVSADVMGRWLPRFERFVQAIE